MSAPTRPRLGRRRLVRARGDAGSESVRRRLRPRVLLSVALAALLIAVLGWLGYGTSLLGVREIAVSGSQIAGADAVRAAAAVATGTPLARLDTDDVADRVRALPSVARVEVWRSWP